MSRRLRLVACVLVVAGAVACNKKNDKAKPAASTQTAPQTGAVILATSAADLGLSKALSLDVPESVKGTGAGVPTTEAGKVTVGALLAPKRSKEACEVRQRIRESHDLMREIAVRLCYFEVEAKQMPFGRKWAMGDESVWVDNSAPDKLRIQVCTGGKLTEEIVVTGAMEGRSRGSFVLKAVDEDVDYHVEGAFDTGYTDPRRSRFMTKMIYEDNEIYHRERLAMSLDQDGISVVSGAYDGIVVPEDEDAEPFWYVESGIAKIGPRLGAAMVFGASGETVGTEELETQFSYRGYFDNAGRILAESASPAFGPRGRLKLTPSMVPAPLSDRFEPRDFGADAWDCSGAEPVTKAATDAEYARCDALQEPFLEEDCEAEVFAYSNEQEVTYASLAEDDEAVYEGAFDDDEEDAEE